MKAVDPKDSERAAEPATPFRVSPNVEVLVHDAMHEPAQIARYLRAIADGLEAGRISLRSGERVLELHPGNLCTFELRSTLERQRVKLQLQLGWREAPGAAEAALEIASK
jgi:amphi-Trp domain-containing protein